MSRFGRTDIWGSGRNDPEVVTSCSRGQGRGSLSNKSRSRKRRMWDISVSTSVKILLSREDKS